MGQTAWTELVSEIHASDYQLVAAITGGGSKAISQLLDVAGASRTILEAIVPYSSASLAEWLGGMPEQCCSQPTARSMAMAAWIRARRLAPETETPSLLGVGATASLATDRPKRGEHRVHVAVQTLSQTTAYSWQMAKGRRDRKKEQWLAAKFILLAIGENCGIDTIAAKVALNGQLVEGEQIDRLEQHADDAWSKLLTGQIKCLDVLKHSQPDSGETDTPRLVFPGAFNPLHEGHLRMAHIAASKHATPAAFELSITNVDKPPLDFIELRHRIGAFRQQAPDATLLLTDAPTFRAKSEIFPGCTFVVGADTLARIADPAYYDGSQAEFEEAIRLIAGRGCRFLVFGRLVDGTFQGLGSLCIPPALRLLCDEVTEKEFRQDISSTQLRARSRACRSDR